VSRELEEQIQVVAAITHLNSERLDYEIHVLNKHEEENSVVKSEQKRKITVLQVLSPPIILNIKKSSQLFEY
jgi:dynein regulatory complex protein 1